MYKAYISGTGSYLPEKQLSNKDLEQMVDTSDEWITERTGIKNRHIAHKDEATSDLSLVAARNALEAANLTPDDLNLIIVATVTPDQVMPSAACELQNKLGAPNTTMSFDLTAACSGFVYGLNVAKQFVSAGKYNHVLVVGAETLSRVVDYTDRETCILFGDGAGAAIVSRAPENSKSEIISEHMHSDGSLGELLKQAAGGSRIPITKEIIDSGLQYVTMKGREIFRHATRTMVERCFEAIESSGIKKDDVNWVIPHQANIRIIDAVGKKLDIPYDRFVINVQDTGNTSAATIPVALDQAVRDGRIQRGHSVLLTAFGAGLTSGSIMLRY